METAVFKIEYKENGDRDWIYVVDDSPKLAIEKFEMLYPGADILSAERIVPIHVVAVMPNFESALSLVESVA